MCHIRGPGEHDDRAGENQGHGVNAAKLSHVLLKYHTLPFNHKNELSGSCSTATYSGSIHWQRGKERGQSMLCLACVRQTALWGAVAFETGLRNIHVKKILASEFLLLWTKLCFHVFLGVLLSGWWRRLHSLRTHLRANIWDSDHLHPSESAFYRRSVALLQFTLTSAAEPHRARRNAYTVRARGQCEQEPPRAHAAQTWEVAWVFYLRHADIITEQVIIKLFSYQQTKPCDLVYSRSQPTRAAAHRDTFMQMRHTFPHPELDANSHSLQTHIRKHKCTKHAHTRRYCSLSIPNPDDRAVPPHNNLFMKSKNVSGSRLQNTHGTRLEGAIVSRNLKLETRPKNTLEEASYTTEAPALRKLLQLCKQPTC